MTTKITKLLNFIKEYSHLPKQGSDAWKELRLKFIGGSEIASVIRKNKHKTPSKLIAGKLGFDPFTGSVITHWGNVFEELIRRYSQRKFKCCIMETGSIPYKDNILSYSPDGLAVVNTDLFIKEFGDNYLDSNDKDQLVLFEFKCPYMRIPTTEIPEHYLPQISIGMNIIDIMEVGIFIQAIYRRCSFEQLRYNRKYNAMGHFKKLELTKDPIECGFMVIYSDKCEEASDCIEMLNICCEQDEIYLNDKSIFDLGSISEASIFETIMEHCVSKKFQVDYEFYHEYDQPAFNNEKYCLYNKSLEYQAKLRLKQKMNTYSDKIIIGVLPYKLLDVFLTPVKKNAEYIQEVDAFNKSKIVLDCIEEHKDFTCKKELAKSVKKWKL